MLALVNTQEEEAIIRRMAMQVVISAYNGGEGHVPSALSILDILYAISTLNDNEKDHFILSKGHASLGYYAMLSSAGLISEDWVESFAKFESPYGGHPHRKKISSVTASTGSLGHGLPLAVGVALGKKIRLEEGLSIVLLGDGEVNEGTTWEASLFALHHNLSNLVAIIDFNKSGERAIRLEGLSQKFEGMGWDVVEVDGHDVSALRHVILNRDGVKPRVVIARTIKGFRIKEIEDNPAWHHTKVLKPNLDAFLMELK